MRSGGGSLRYPSASALLASNLLPGLRDLRAPLAAGYLWLLAIWLLVSRHVDPNSTDAVLVAFRRLHLADQPLLLIGAVTLAAYLTGTAATEIAASLRRGGRTWINRWAGGGAAVMTLEGRGHADVAVRPPAQVDFHPMSARGRRVIDDLVRKELKTLNALPNEEREGVARSVFGGLDPAAAVVQQFSEVRSQLQARASPLFDEVDRMRAEADFRYAISVPLFVVLLIALAGWQPSFAATAGFVPLAAAPAVILFMLGGRAERRSNDALGDALLANVASAPCLMELRAAVGDPTE